MKYFKNISLILVFSVLFSEENIEYSKLPTIGNNELTNFKSEVVDFSDLYKEGPLLVSFWFLGCGPCVAEMKHLSKFNEKYKDTGFKVISISTDTKSKGKIKSFAKKKKYTFDMLFDRNGKDGVLKKLGSSSCPFTALINMDGTIYSKHLGYERGDEVALEKEIEELIEYNNQFKIESTIDPALESKDINLQDENNTEKENLEVR